MSQIERTSFTFSDYADLLGALKNGGYTCSFFDNPEGDKPLLLRHDIDKNLGWALDIAKMEHQKAFKATYFFLLRSPMYSLLSRDNSKLLNEIQNLGHRIGLHCYLPKEIEESRIDETVHDELKLFGDVTGIETNVVSFHNPPSAVVRRSPESQHYISAYDPAFMPPQIKYISDSNAFFREGSPLESLKAGEYECLQLLTHPIWWARKDPKPITQVLLEAYRRVTDNLDSYLCESNTVWEEFRSIEGIDIHLAPKS